MIEVVGAVDASTIHVAGSVAITSVGFEDSTATPGAHGDLTGRDEPGQHSSDAVTVGADTLTDYLAGLSGGGADHTVGLFAADIDAAGGSFTEVTILGSSAIPRSYVVGASMLVTEGDDYGIWTITASGPCTPGAALAPADVIASENGRIAVAYTADGTTVAGVYAHPTMTTLGELETVLSGRLSVAESGIDAIPTDLWLATAADNPGTTLLDHGDKRAHAVFTQAIDSIASATGVIPLPAGTWSVHPSYDGFNHSRPRIPDRAGLAFADGMRIMWRGRIGVVDGWEGHNGLGYGDVICNQSTGSDGILDSFEPGLRYELDPPRIRAFVDNTPAGSGDLAGDEYQDYSDPLALDLALGSDFLIDITFPGGERVYEFYVPCAAGDTPDLTLPGEVVEDWTLHTTTSRTAPGGFYRSGLEWRLGDQTNALAWLKAWDLGTGDLEIDFDAADVTTAGWTDGAGNDWTATEARVVEGPCIYIGAGTAYIEPAALNPGEGDWTMAWWAQHTDVTSTVDAGSGWTLTPDPGGAVLTFDDGTTSVDVPLGITDSDYHFVIVSLDRATEVATATVDGLLVATVDISGLGNVTGDAGMVLPDGHALRYLSFQADALTLPAHLDLYDEAVASLFPVAPTGSGLDEAAVQALIDTAVANLLDGAPGALDTLNELAAALDDDASFAASVTTALAGKVPTTRTITAGTGLTGGGTLASDRSLAVAYGLTATTAAQGDSVCHATWRAGSYYGTSVPRIVNAGQTVASGQVKAMAFYNPVSGRTFDQLAVDVQAGSAGSGILYVCSDTGAGYPGGVLYSAAMSTPTTSTRSTGSVSGTLPVGLLWFVAHGTGTTWSGLSLDGQSPYLPVAATYAVGAINCWNATGAGTSTLTSFPAGAAIASTGVQVLIRAS